ncbi:MAG: TldD/PmbA family protein [Actinomycetes bacterium]
MQPIDQDFLALDLDAIADAAMGQGSSCQEVLLRIHRTSLRFLSMHDGDVEASSDSTDLAMSVRVLIDGSWGFAGSQVISVPAAIALVKQACALAVLSKPLARISQRPAPEPSHGRVTWVSDYQIDPFSVPSSDVITLLRDRSHELLKAPITTHADLDVTFVKEATFVAHSNGSRISQQRVRVGPSVQITTISELGFDSLKSLAPPVGRGWEYLLGTGWDWDGELAQLPELLEEKHRAPTVDAGTYDIVIDGTNLWLTIHESIGHATELDRILGYESNYAGTSFVPADGVGTLKYGSPRMNIRADRTVPHGLATTGFDDEAVKTTQWDLVADGYLAGFQLDRATAGLAGYGQSNGCAYAESGTLYPIQRMANVNLVPDPNGPSMQQLLATLDDGLYIVGDNSWSIDMQRYNFQFTGQRFHRVKNGVIVGQVKDAAYQGRTPDFWASMEVLGNESTYKLMGALNCGKAQPGQSAPVSHGTPSALFRGVNILNSTQEVQ